MDTIHELSSVVALPAYDSFGVIGTQIMVNSYVKSEYRPISTIGSCMAPINFQVPTALDEYSDLSRSEFYICLNVKLSKSNMAKDPTVTADDWKKICPVNYLMNSMFKQVRVAIGHTTVSSSSLNYGYVAYLDALLNYSSESKNTFLQSAFWYRDTTTAMESINEKRSQKIWPTGNNLAEGCDLEMYGNLHIDLGSQIKALMGGVTLDITLFPNDPKFYLQFDKLLSPTVEIKDVRFYVHKSKLNPQVVIAHNRALELGNARYFITRKEVKSFIIQKGTIDCYLNNVENGVQPIKVYVGLVKNEASNGSGDLNPFYFKNYSVRHIACYLDGVQYPQRPYTPDFNRKMYTREYFGLFETANELNCNTKLDITKDEFYDGFTLFGFNFLPDSSDGCNKSGYVSPIRRGNLRIEIRFNHPLNETVSAIVFYEFNNLIEIPSNRTALKDFN